MKTNSNCCAETYCETSIAELPRYYPRQLITPDDLTLEQNYFRDRMRRHNRLMHGWGVVCGARVCPVVKKAPDGTTSFVPWQVKIGRGYILGPYGDEIMIDCERTVDLRTRGVTGVTGEPCLDVPDPWCTQVFVLPPEESTVYVAIKYKQCKARPVRVQPVGCGCDDTACEYSRWQDGYEIGVLPECPSCNTGPAPFNPCSHPPFIDLEDMCNSSDCPDCSCGPWVGLASVTIDPDGTIKAIDNCSCRRMAVSLSTLWWVCGEELTNVAVVGAPVQVTAGDPSVTVVTVTGTNLNTEAIYSFGDGVEVRNPRSTGSPPGTSIDLDVTAKTTAPLGFHELRVINPDCSFAVVQDALEVIVTVSGARGAASPKAGKAAVKPGRSSKARRGRSLR